MIRLVWIRHAEKAYDNNKGPRGSPSFDPPLTDEGTRQAGLRGAELVRRYGNPIFCLSSPYLRTRQTAVAMLREVKSECKQYVDPNISEYLGNWSASSMGGLESGTIKYGVLPPVGESMGLLRERCEAHLVQFKLETFKTGQPGAQDYVVWIITHGLVITTLAAAMATQAGLTMPAIPHKMPPLGALVLEGRRGEGATGSWTEAEAENAGLGRSYAKAQLTADLIDLINQRTRTRSAPRLESKSSRVVKALHSWLMGMANEGELYEHLDEKSPVHGQFIKELLDGQLMNRTQAMALLESFFDRIRRRVVSSLPDGAIKFEEGILKYGRFKFKLDKRMERLRLAYGEEATLNTALYYSALGESGHHWGRTQTHYNRLYTEFEVRGEGFCSPQNSRLLGMPGANICTVSAVADRVYGSLGSFLKINPLEYKGNWSINPPFIVVLDTQVVTRLHEVLHQAVAQSLQIGFFTLLPDWGDAEFIGMMDSSAYLVAGVRLLARQYMIEMPTGEVIPSPINTRYYYHSSLPVNSETRDRIKAFLSSPE